MHYFISLIIEQQTWANKYHFKQTVLGVIILTQPYKINQLTGEPIKENVMTIDFDPRNIDDERIKIWKHQLVFLNPNSKYKKDNTPKKYQDWLDLFYASVNDNKKMRICIKLFVFINLPK